MKAVCGWVWIFSGLQNLHVGMKTGFARVDKAVIRGVLKWK